MRKRKRKREKMQGKRVSKGNEDKRKFKKMKEMKGGMMK